MPTSSLRKRLHLRIEHVPLAAAAILGFAPETAAAPSARTSSLAWIRLPGAESCIDARALAHAVERRLGRVAFVAPAYADAAIEARIERIHTPGAWRATISVFDTAGTRIGFRELQADRPDCHAINDELELVIALLIDPNAALAPAAQFTSPAPALSPPVMPPPVVPAPVVPLPVVSPSVIPAPVMPPTALCPPPRPPTHSTPFWRAGIEAGAVGGLGMLPKLAGLGFEIRAHVAPPRGPSFDFGGSFWLDRSIDAGSGHASFSLTYGWLSVCPLDLARRDTALSACLGGQLGSLQAVSAGFPVTHHQEQLVVNIAAETRVRRRFVGPLFGSLGFGLAVAAVRDRFYYFDTHRTRQDIFQMAPLAGLLDLAIGLELR